MFSIPAGSGIDLFVPYCIYPSWAIVLFYYVNSSYLRMNSFVKICSIIYCISINIQVSLLSAQNKLDSIQHINEVVITGNRYNEVIPSQKLTGKELENLNSLSIADALRYFSGIQLKDYGGVGGIKTVNIRSMGTNHMGVYYNGIQLGNAQNGQIDLGKYSLENIEEISLYNGQKSEIFQSAREFGSAGSIYITTRRPNFAEGKTANLKAGLKAGSFDYINPSVLFEYKLNNNLSASFNTEWINASGKYKFRYRRVTPSGELAYDTTAIRQNGDIDAVRIEGGLQGYFPNGRWNGSGLRSFLRSGGTVQTLCSKSISDHFASLNSACRVAVRTPKTKALCTGLSTRRLAFS